MAPLGTSIRVGQASVGIGANTTATAAWMFTRMGYQWEPWRGRVGAVGITGDFAYSQLEVSLTAPAATEAPTVFHRRVVSAATVGTLATLRLASRATVNVDVALMQLNDLHSGLTVPDADLFATVALSRHLGARLGYRFVKFDYDRTTRPFDSVIIQDVGNLRMRAPYGGLVVGF